MKFDLSPIKRAIIKNAIKKNQNKFFFFSKKIESAKKINPK